MCKKCCRDKCHLDNLDCIGHRILIKTKRQYRESKFNVTDKIVEVL